MQHCVVGKKQVTTFFLFFSVWLHWRTNLYVGSEAADPMVISVCASINVAVQWLPILSCRLFIAYFIIHNITATLTIRWRQSIFNQPRCIYVCVSECVCVWVSVCLVTKNTCLLIYLLNDHETVTIAKTIGIEFHCFWLTFGVCFIMGLYIHIRLPSFIECQCTTDWGILRMARATMTTTTTTKMTTTKNH